MAFESEFVNLGKEVLGGQGERERERERKLVLRFLCSFYSVVQDPSPRDNVPHVFPLELQLSSDTLMDTPRCVFPVRLTVKCNHHSPCIENP